MPGIAPVSGLRCDSAQKRIYRDGQPVALWYKSATEPRNFERGRFGKMKIKYIG